MAVSWVLAADGGYAKILQADNRAAPLVLLEELEHPEARKKNNDFYTDSAGRSFDSGGQGRHAMESQFDAKSIEAQRFAKDLCAKLRQAALQNRFEKLYVVEAPAFLGVLRECLDDNAKTRIAGEIPKDVARQAPEDIRSKLPDYL
ncbi:host attachment protein [Thiolapillus sp.]|uniref:host attachment protein n=3 Tax=Thiolapillus sp. TaxID=2017437 RepID=UPI0025EF5803|nr:host attachment protein [Thiolapillus sp.]